jgi:hypothetical protein
VVLAEEEDVVERRVMRAASPECHPGCGTGCSRLRP